MKTSLPTGNWLWFWRVHLIVLIGYLLFECAKAMRVVIADPVWLSPAGAAAALLAAILILGPVFAETGYLFQRRFSTPAFWRALFAVYMVIVGFSIVANIGLGTLGIFNMPPASEFAGFIVFAGELFALWLYAYRSGHLWETEKRRPESLG